MKKHYKNIVVGFGKGGKTLAKFLARQHEEVLVIEQSNQMYGGTCINIGCLPSKNLILNGRRGISFTEAIQRRGEMTAQLRNKNYHLLADEPTVTVLDGHASFTGNHQINVKLTSGGEVLVEGERIFINTGAQPVIPNIPGLTLNDRIVTSTEAMTQSQLPKRLAILGGGHIGLEFAEMFNSYGSKVTVFDHHDQLLAQMEPEVAKMVAQDLATDGVAVKLKTKVNQVVTDADGVEISFAEDGQTQHQHFDLLLVATGRQPNTGQLGLENTSIELDNHGAIKVDDHLRTTVDKVWALGDVNGGPQFTYISLDDFRIVKDQLFGNGQRTTLDRQVVPHSTFITPPLSSVGMTEASARQAGKQVLVFQLKSNSIPKARVIEDQRGMLKAVVDRISHEILGATIYAAESHELINLIALAMKGHLQYEMLREMIYTHPTMAEAFNDLFKQPIQDK
ncbi:FAD-dependent oxidoreductase [uncultured Limosilactobacillus sp.]|uniref:FAD-dependent oxidoreductase n=1 Tax=uncultured Limosilactobacillus sp. TaxID=2837629 RepID=UPI0025F732CE|nr:FAD-dependent oxidoreductase [uncultured Limosilactobacillus sp.]